MKVMAEGRGFIAVPTIAAGEAEKRYGFQIIGSVPNVTSNCTPSRRNGGSNILPWRRSRSSQRPPRPPNLEGTARLNPAVRAEILAGRRKTASEELFVRNGF